MLDQDLRTPLHLAILGNHLPVARLLLAQCGTGLLSRRDIMSLTPLHLAAIQGQVSMLRRLVSALREDTGPDTPLHTLAGQACEQVGLGCCSMLPQRQMTAHPGKACMSCAELAGLQAGSSNCHSSGQDLGDSSRSCRSPAAS